MRDSFGPLANDLGAQSQQDRSPVTTGIGLSHRATDRAPVAHLDVGDTPGAIGQDGDVTGGGRFGNGAVSGQRAEADLTIALFDPVQARNEVEIDQIGWRRQTQLHEWNQDSALRPEAWPRLPSL